MGRRWWQLAMVGFAFLGCLLGCGDDAEPANETPAEATATDVEGAPDEPGPSDQAPAEAAESGPVVTDAAFELRAATSGEYTAGQLGQFAITLTPLGEWHVNEEYPIAVALTGVDAVSFPKAELEREDAAEFGEQVARFDVPFTPGSAGEHRIEAKVSFAVCTPENCVPDERTLALLLPVQ
jgi:hypothetical protein